MGWVLISELFQFIDLSPSKFEQSMQVKQHWMGDRSTRAKIKIVEIYIGIHLHYPYTIHMIAFGVLYLAEVP